MVLFSAKCSNDELVAMYQGVANYSVRPPMKCVEIEMLAEKENSPYADCWRFATTLRRGERAASSRQLLAILMSMAARVEFPQALACFSHRSASARHAFSPARYSSPSALKDRQNKCP